MYNDVNAEHMQKQQDILIQRRVSHYDGDYLIHEASTSGQEISYVRGLTYLLKNETIESEV